MVIDINALNSRRNDLERLKQNFKGVVKEEEETARKYRQWGRTARSLMDSSMSGALESIADQEAEHSMKFTKMVNLIADMQIKILHEIEKLKREEERKKTSQIKDQQMRYGRR